MVKSLSVTDRQYDWFAARARRADSMRQAIDQIIKGIDEYEKALAKYQSWCNAVAESEEQGGF